MIFIVLNVIIKIFNIKEIVFHKINFSVFFIVHILLFYFKERISEIIGLREIASEKINTLNYSTTKTMLNLETISKILKLNTTKHLN